MADDTTEYEERDPVTTPELLAAMRRHEELDNMRAVAIRQYENLTRDLLRTDAALVKMQLEINAANPLTPDTLFWLYRFGTTPTKSILVEATNEAEAWDNAVRVMRDEGLLVRDLDDTTIFFNHELGAEIGEQWERGRK